LNIPDLFDRLDVDNKGVLDDGKVVQSLALFCDDTNRNFDSRQLSKMIDDCSFEDGNFDRREFSVFLIQYSEQFGIPIAELLGALQLQMKDENKSEAWSLWSKGRFRIFGGSEQKIDAFKFWSSLRSHSAKEASVDDDSDNHETTAGGRQRNRWSHLFMPNNRAASSVIMPDDTMNSEEDEQDRIREIESAWLLLPDLFMIWDVDSSGYLDAAEMYAGIENYCEAKGHTFDSRSISEIFTEADLNGHSQLDAREFSVFLTLCCQRIEEIRLNDLAIFMREQLLEILLDTDDGSLEDGSDQDSSKLIGSFMRKLTRRGKQEEVNHGVLSSVSQQLSIKSKQLFALDR
jgi:Ca2+-binding EF-hand superfamily protein